MHAFSQVFPAAEIASQTHTRDGHGLPSLRDSGVWVPFAFLNFRGLGVGGRPRGRGGLGGDGTRGRGRDNSSSSRCLRSICRNFS